MPRFDGNGPQGTGPNGRGLGPCGQGQTDSSRVGLFGFRRGFRGRGRGFGWFNTNSFDEKENLESTKRRLKEQLDALEKRMENLQ
jgi:hypothetical protein